MDQAKLLVKQIIFNVKNIFSNKINLLLMLFFIFIAILIPIVFIPFIESAGIVHTIVLIPVSAIVFSSINYNVRHSTLNANLGLTKSNRWLFYLSTLFTMLIFTVAASALIDMILIIFNNINLLMLSWMTKPSSVPVANQIIFNFTFEVLIIFFYCSVVMTFIVFGISFVLQHIIKSSKTYFVIIFSLLLLNVIFGGTFNGYYYPSTTDGMVLLENPLFPQEMYWFSAIFPFFPIGSLYRQALNITTTQYNDVLEIVASSQKYAWTLHHSSTLGLLWINNSWRWNLLMITPWIEVVAFFILGTIISKVYRR